MNGKRLQSDYLPDGAQAATLAKFRQTEAGRILFHAFAKRIEQRTNTYRKNLRVNPEDGTEDIRFRVGEVAGLEFLAELEAAATAAVNAESRAGEDHE